MRNKNIISKILGEDFESNLIKSEAASFVKVGTNVSVSPQEMYMALQIVPRTVISLLVQKLKPLSPGQMVDIAWPCDNATHNIHIEKISSDLYSGQITGEGRVLAKFGYRSLPAVGLVIMSTYELYDKETNKQDLSNPSIDYAKVQQMIDERVRMQAMIEDVVSKKISERDALQQLIVQKINDFLRNSHTIKQQSPVSEDLPEKNEGEEQGESEEQNTEETSQEPDVDDISVEEDVAELEPTKEQKKSKLKEFLQSKNSDVKKKEVLSIHKNQIDCQYCSSSLYKGGDTIDLCLCYGEKYGTSIKIKKNKNNEYVFKYPKNFGIDNANMLLSSLKTKR